jgi:circadian clock protein KaiC
MAAASGGQQEQLARFRSGIPGLDKVLGGGLLRGAVYIVQGVPGTGKTILAHQICFEHIRESGRALYVTVLSESHSRMMRNMSSLSFYDASVIPSSLYYVSAYQALDQEGLKGLTTLIRREIERLGTQLLVFDGLTAADRMTASSTQFKQFVHDLQSISTVTDCSMLLLTSAEDTAVLPEQTMVEGVIELTRRVPAAQSLRYLEVKKFRGSDYLDGRHAMQITQDGIVVYPRLEAAYNEPADNEPRFLEKVGTGIASLDELLGGGLPSGTTTLILGPSGCGKTTLGLHFLGQSGPAERGLYFGFYETPNRLKHKAKSIGVDLATLEAEHSMILSWEAPTERILDRLGNRLIDLVRENGVRRLLVDGLDAMRLSAPGPERLSRFVTALANELRAMHCTSLFTLESPQMLASELSVPIDGISVIAENLIVMRYVEIDASVRRLFAVLKVRDSQFDARLQEMTIRDGGVVLAPTFGRAEGLLGGHARRNVFSLVHASDQEAFEPPSDIRS